MEMFPTESFIFEVVDPTVVANYVSLFVISKTTQTINLGCSFKGEVVKDLRREIIHRSLPYKCDSIRKEIYSTGINYDYFKQTHLHKSQKLQKTQNADYVKMNQLFAQEIALQKIQKIAQINQEDRARQL